MEMESIPLYERLLTDRLSRFGSSNYQRVDASCQFWIELNIYCHVGTIGAVFDFYAGTAKRTPQWWQDHSLEWLYRLCLEPKRMWRRKMEEG